MSASDLRLQHPPSPEHMWSVVKSNLISANARESSSVTDFLLSKVEVRNLFPADPVVQALFIDPNATHIWCQMAAEYLDGSVQVDGVTYPRNMQDFESAVARLTEDESNRLLGTAVQAFLAEFPQGKKS